MPPPVVVWGTKLDVHRHFRRCNGGPKILQGGNWGAVDAKDAVARADHAALLGRKHLARFPVFVEPSDAQVSGEYNAQVVLCVEVRHEVTRGILRGCEACRGRRRQRRPRG